jgi:hypothetical protein
LIPLSPLIPPVPFDPPLPCDFRKSQKRDKKDRKGATEYVTT